VEERDATRRTQLANERTHLAWWRTGLTALAVGIGAGRIVPELTEDTAWPFQLLGAGYALLGCFFIAYGLLRREQVDQALVRGEWAPFPAAVALATTGGGLILGVATIAVIVFTGT
jgi:putative membrane protein